LPKGVIRVMAGGDIGACPVSSYIDLPAYPDPKRFLILREAAKGYAAIYRTQSRRRPRANYIKSAPT